MNADDSMADGGLVARAQGGLLGQLAGNALGSYAPKLGISPSWRTMPATGETALRRLSRKTVDMSTDSRHTVSAEESLHICMQPIVIQK
jgi:hypothetical protein